MADAKTQPRALVSVYDKRNLAPFIAGLVELGFEILSSGGTSKELADHKIPHIQVSDLTGYAEALDGRVKTLHPVIHAGILANPDDPDHLDQLKEIGTSPIGLVVCNLYPFHTEPSTELIDIGGPTMVRAAAKNREYVGVIIDPDDYEKVLAELKENSILAPATKQELAQKAFSHTARYDTAISNWLSGDSQEAPQAEKPPQAESLPETINLTLKKVQSLRYGENPHQEGALYQINGENHGNSDSFLENTEQLNGKELSYLNIYDLVAGWSLTHKLPTKEAPASAVIIKHANPCGAALAEDIATAFSSALMCDPVSAFGGIVALNEPVNEELASALNDLFIEVVIAPGYEPAALKILKNKKNLRILKAPPPEMPALHIRSAGNAVLIQTNDNLGEHKEGEWTVVTTKKPAHQQWHDLVFAEKIAAAVSSNAIVIAKDQMALGIGAGQQNRRDSARLAAEKARGTDSENRAAGGVMASDGFLPFADGLDGAIQAGCTVVLQPGGSVRDEEVIAAADAAGLSMVFTGRRRFRH